MALWQSSQAQKGNRKPFNLAGGLNNGTPAFNLQENESVDEYGFTTDQFPALHTRGGRVPYGALASAPTNLLINFLTRHLIRAVGTALQYDNNGVWTNIAGTFANGDWDATNFEVAGADALILTNGTDAVKYWNGTALADLNANAPKGKFITNDTVRVWIAKGDTLHFCGFLNAQDWTSAENSGSVQYYTSNGGDITGLVNFANHICVFKVDSFAEIFGTNYYNFKLVENSNNIGCVSAKTIQEVGESGLFWLGQNDVYRYLGGQPVGIGQKIRKYLNSINRAQISKCFGATDGIRYYLGLVTGTNTEPDTLLVYDPRFQIWRVSSLNDNFRYGAILNNVWYIGNATGQVYKMDQGNSDNGTAIPWMVVSKDFDEGIPEAEKEYYELHLQANIPTGTVVNVGVSTDQGKTYIPIGDPITAADGDQNINIVIPLDTVPLANWIRFKFSGTGEFTLHNIERYFRVEPVMQ